MKEEKEGRGGGQETDFSEGEVPRGLQSDAEVYSSLVGGRTGEKPKVNVGGLKGWPGENQHAGLMSRGDVLFAEELIMSLGSRCWTGGFDPKGPLSAP